MEKVDAICVIKHQRILQLKYQGEVVKSYTISLGKQPIGHKEVEGDGKTPEGEYWVDSKTTDSEFHKNLGISYPNAKDIAKAERLHQSPGGLIKIHGFKNDFTGNQEEAKKDDWTAGCIAVTNQEMDEIYEITPIHIPITILP